MKAIIIIRDFKEDKQALGSCYVLNESSQIIFKSESIERGWHDNERNISCVPEGTYKVVLEHSPKFNSMLWELKGVPNRSECKFHTANYARQLNGCIALGKNRADIDGDGYFDVTSSGDTMDLFHEVLNGEKETVVIIKNSPL